ncbi:MAG: hypothetical protein N2645_15350 [Clostridia bacterium]|nr:hypothetical protein [Clostridia bacterium]
MVKKNLIYFLVLAFILLSMQTIVFSIGEGNIDGGGGGMGQGTSDNYWNSGDDGIRVTIIRDSDNSVASTSIDFTNKNPTYIQVHFGKVSKVQYRNGLPLTPLSSIYKYYNPQQVLPQIVSSDGNTNIDAIKSYFTDEQIIRSIAKLIGFSFDDLINGNYKLLLEPIAYFTFSSIKVAMTAHEAALYDQVLGGTLRGSMPSLTHKNLPLSMFLETSDLGFPAWHGPTSQKVSDDQIISSLGLGIVRFREADPAVTIGGSSYEYRVNTDVITAVMINTNSKITPDNPVSVNFNINGSVYSVTDIFIPEGESQIVWVKWHTPSTPQVVKILAWINNSSVKTSNGSQSTSIIAKIVDLNENTPPNPTAADTKPNRFVIPSLPNKAQKTTASWGVWGCYWKTNWVWISNWAWISTGVDDGYWQDNGNWVDHGSWEYYYTNYRASLSAKMTVTPDSKVPTASGKTMRSGYGINLHVNTNFTSNAPSSAITGVQNVISYYPEFDYATYWRLSDLTTGGYNAEFDLKPNEFSTYRRRVHFTPLWVRP